jgi:hypothetical protein
MSAPIGGTLLIGWLAIAVSALLPRRQGLLQPERTVRGAPRRRQHLAGPLYGLLNQLLALALAISQLCHGDETSQRQIIP